MLQTQTNNTHTNISHTNSHVAQTHTSTTATTSKIDSNSQDTKDLQDTKANIQAQQTTTDNAKEKQEAFRDFEKWYKEKQEKDSKEENIERLIKEALHIANEIKMLQEKESKEREKFERGLRNSIHKSINNKEKKLITIHKEIKKLKGLQ